MPVCDRTTSTGELFDLGRKGMFLVVTGSGSALADPERGGASAAVVVDGTVLQFDLGRLALENLLRAGIKPTNIDYLFFTHHHFDHIASLGYFLISNWIAGRHELVHVLGPAGTAAMSNGVEIVHAGDMAFGRDVHDNWPAEAPGRPAASPPHRAVDISEGIVLETGLFKVTALDTVHYTYPGAVQKSVAYRVDTQYGAVVISGDTGPVETMAGFSKGANILVHEAQRPDPGMTTGGKMARADFKTTLSGTPRGGGGHTSPSEIGKIAAQAGVEMAIATHLPPYTSVAAAVDLAAPYTGRADPATIWPLYRAAMSENFTGAVVVAEDAMVFEICVY